MFYERLKALCEERDVSLRSLSSIIGTGTSTLGAWRNGGAPSSTFIVKIADYFSVSCDWLLGRTDDPAPPDSTGLVLRLSEDEQYYIEKLRTCDLQTQKRAMICGLVVMGCSPDRDQLPSLRSGSHANGGKGLTDCSDISSAG